MRSCDETECHAKEEQGLEEGWRCVMPLLLVASCY